jgi:hypothetical protein
MRMGVIIRVVVGTINVMCIPASNSEYSLNPFAQTPPP